MAHLPLDPRRIRALFPAFHEASLKDTAYVENAGGSFTARPGALRLSFGKVR